MRRHWAEAVVEPARTFTAIERVGGVGNKNAEPHELWAELVTDVQGLRRRVLEVQPDLRDGVIGTTPHTGCRVFVRRFQAARRLRGSLLSRCDRRRRRRRSLILRPPTSSFDEYGTGTGTRSLKNTAVITPRLAVLP